MRGPVEGGDKLKVSALDDSGPISYPLARVPNSVSYETVSEQPEVEPNQHLPVRLSFHGGIAYSDYDERTAGAFINDGMILHEPGIIRPPIAPTTVTLNTSAGPPKYFFETVGPSKTIGKDSGNISSSKTTATSLTFSHTVASGDNRVLEVSVSIDAGDVSIANSITVAYGGVSLTQGERGRITTGGLGNDGFTSSLWYLAAPAVGTEDVVVTVNTSVSIAAGAVVYTDVDQDSPFTNTAAANGTSTAPSVTISSNSGEVVIDNVATGSDGSTVTVTDDVPDELWNENLTIASDTGIIGAASAEAGASSVTASWTLSESKEWVTVAASLRQAPGPLLYVIGVESGKVNIFKISLENTNFATLLNTKAFAVVTTEPMGRPAEFNDGTNTYWRLGLGDNGKIQRLTTIASGTGNDTWTASADADARHLKVVGNQLIRSTDENQVSILPRGSDPMTEANWGGDFFAGDVSSNITELGEASGLGYVAKEDGFYEWDLIGEAQNVLPDIQQAERNGQGMTYWHGGFMIPASSGLSWTLTGQPEGPDSNPENRGNDPSLGSTDYFKHGRWLGGATFGAYTYRLYVSSAGTNAFLVMIRERKQADPPGPMPLISYVVALPVADFNDFRGVFITETSRFSATETRPCLWYANGNDLSYIWLDKDGAPLSRRGDIDLATSGSVTSGRIDGEVPNVPKQLWAIEGWAEDFGSVSGNFQFSAAIDGGSFNSVGSAISSDGFFRKFWTQDTNDTGRTMLVRCAWTGSSSLTDTNGPHLRDVTIRLVALPRTSREWTFLFGVEDEQSKTAKKVRSELEAYVGDMKKFTLPDRDSMNGVMGKIRMLRADEISRLTPRNQTPPSYVISASVREVSGS